MRHRNILISLLVVLILSQSVFADGRGEISIINNNTFFMSYDEQIREVRSENLFNDEGVNYYLSETDTNFSLYYRMDTKKVYLTLIPAPNTDLNTRYPFYLCTLEEIKDRNFRRFVINNNGVCPEPTITYYFGDLRTNYDYDFSLPKRTDLSTVPFLWFIGNGKGNSAGGGGSCGCLPNVYGVEAQINSVDSSYLVNTQDTIQIGVNYLGASPVMCYGSTIRLEYKPTGYYSFIVVRNGLSSDFGSDIVDCSGSNCYNKDPTDSTNYNHNIDLQQVDNNVDFRSYFSCTGSLYDGAVSPVIDSEIINENPVIQTNFTNNSEYSSQVNFYFNATDSSPHIRNISLYITNDLNETYTTTLDYTASHEFSKTFSSGTYTMFGVVNDYFGLTDYTGTYFFNIASEETSENKPLRINALNEDSDDNIYFLPFAFLIVSGSLIMFKARKEENP